jgi:hypothetical protein
MKYAYARALHDEELRSHLQRGDTVLFTKAAHNWEEIEQQVERLGFGDTYAVSRGTKPEPSGQQTHTRVSPLRQQAEA